MTRVDRDALRVQSRSLRFFRVGKRVRLAALVIATFGCEASALAAEPERPPAHHPAPAASPPGGLYVTPPVVRVSGAGVGAHVFATRDGSDPRTSRSRAEVTAPLALSRSTILSLTAATADGTFSPVATEIYVVTTPTPARPPAAGEPAARPEIGPLGRVPVPMPSRLHLYVRDRRAAIALGKALFWDQQVGGDGLQACASCHFSAGADSRSKNQIDPGVLAMLEGGQPNPTGAAFEIGEGPNHQLSPGDFPFHRLADPNDRRSLLLFDSNDIASSQGVFNSLFKSIVAGSGPDLRDFKPDPVFNVDGLIVRRVEPRNTPTMVNAVFNFRNLWDGRAQFEFNGVSPFGMRDPALRDPEQRAGFLVRSLGDGSMVKTHVLIDNASLASQAMGPVLNPFEMSAAGRTFPQVGIKMLADDLVPLAGQDVAADDSVLGELGSPHGEGLAVGYAELVRRAFRPEWWANTGSAISVGPDGAAEIVPMSDGQPGDGQFTQMEWNFSLFFGLAVQLYESTLVADDTPFDRFLSGKSGALGEQARRGLVLFQTKGKCVTCHGGPELTNASVSNLRNQRIERMFMSDEGIAVYDDGFFNTGVRRTLDDVGVGGNDPFGNPLSLARLAVAGKFTDPRLTVAAGERVAANGAFKAPGLRNVALTAPYFHNGGQLTLRQVVDFYNRGGDFHEDNEADLDPDIERLGLTDGEKDDLVAFLESLTDERVRFQRAPFDHPALFLPQGHPGGEHGVTPDADVAGKAADPELGDLLLVPAVGAGGGQPLPRFLEGP